MNNQQEEFRDRELVLATKHGKEAVIGPLLKKHFGVKLLVPKGFDTDKFGTFTRDINRPGNQLETARKKLEAALEFTGADLGVVSEGSFGAHPSVPFIESNLELLLLVDKKYGYEVIGHHRTSETNFRGEYVGSVDEGVRLAKEIGFPDHGVIVRWGPRSRFGIYKNIKTEDELRKVLKRILKVPFKGRAYIESDMRADRNPTRMRAIRSAAEDLVENMKARCPQCDTPGFVPVDFETGLRCARCGLPTELPLFDIYRCDSCGYEDRQRVNRYGEEADPARCSNCNP